MTKKEFDKLISKADAGDMLAIWDLGNSLLDVGRYIDAGKCFYDIKQNGPEYLQARTLNRLGLCYEGIKDYHRAMQAWLEASDKYNEAASQHNIGVFYEIGVGTFAQSYEKAAEWYQKAANNPYDYTLAHYNLALLYFWGKGVNQSYETALEEFRKADAQNYAPATNYIGICYAEGYGVEISYDIAEKYYLKAANLEFSPAQYNLAWHYYLGHGGERNLDKAKSWAEKAQNNGADCDILLKNINADLVSLSQDRSMDSPMIQYIQELLDKKLSYTELYKQLEKDLENDFDEIWVLLEANIRTFLITGMMSYLNFVMLGEAVYKKLDFSASVLPMCKALENELYKYFFVGYINYLKKNKIPAERKQENEITYTRDGIIRYHNLKYYRVREKFTLGKIGYILGIAKGTEYTSVDQDFVKYFNCIRKKQFKNKEINKFLLDFCKDCNDICDAYRNKAAHSNVIMYNTAANCGEDLIKVKKLMRDFIEKIDVEKAKEYIEC